ncbi:hypothetical protein [Thalassotalea aquiviva]|uniref:hypothetical protein n=1 Tax=Thalassotalea aquiviva TaxID=3242415 RepID=UPI00352A6632
MSFLKNLFNKDTPKQRTLNHPKQLRINDIVVFNDSFALPEILRGQQFQVTAVNSYEFEHQVVSEWVLNGHDDTQLYLSLDEDDTTHLKISLLVDEDHVGQLFCLDQFSEVFDEPGQAILDRQTITSPLAQWTCEAYRQNKFAQVGYFHRKDHRCTTLSEFEGKDAGEPFELYALEGNHAQFSIDVEVWQDGDTDVFVNLFRPLTDIVDYFPGSLDE